MNYKINTKAELECFSYRNFNEIHQYIDSKMKGLPIPIYSSVDIREGREKFGSVDHNLYPAGFNNVCRIDLESSVSVFKQAFQKMGPDIKTIGLIPESHTKNTMYLDHLATLAETITKTGIEVLLISLDPGMFPGGETSIELATASKGNIVVHKAWVKAGHFVLEHRPEVKIDVALLNHDQSTPLPVEWKDIKIPVVPTPFLGWYRREKNKHFSLYKNVVDDFCAHFSIDPNLMQAKFKAIEDVDFSTKQGLDRLGEAVDGLKREIPAESAVFVKASKGTYGMGIMVVNSGEEIISMNRRDRNKMDIGKNHIKFTSLLLQEGIETILKYDGAPAEITMYLVDGRCVGGFMRTNSEKGTMSNLNSRGMVFVKFCMSELRQNQEHKCKECIYSMIARLATLASAYELQETL